MDLAKSIKYHYFNNLDSLPKDKRFHFASRLAAWEGEAKAFYVLRDLKPYMNPSENVAETLDAVLARPLKKVYAGRLREKYFEKYPRLYGWHNAMFRLRHLKEIYGIDARAEFLDLAGPKNLEKLYKDLISDPESTCILSRFAVDFIYLYELLFDKSRRFDPQTILGFFKYYDLADPSQLNLAIYLYTHCIIADTMFYIKPVPADRKEIYQQMLKDLENLIIARGDAVKLDAKFEFLVTCRIIQWHSDLFEVINKEASDSLSPDRSFITDRLNGGASRPLNGFSGSEHRNVLFIMSTSAFRPTSTLLQ